MRQKILEVEFSPFRRLYEYDADEYGANDEQHGVYALQAGVFPFRRGKVPFLDNFLIFFEIGVFWCTLKHSSATKAPKQFASAVRG